MLGILIHSRFPTTGFRSPFVAQIDINEMH